MRLAIITQNRLTVCCPEDIAPELVVFLSAHTKPKGALQWDEDGCDIIVAEQRDGGVGFGMLDLFNRRADGLQLTRSQFHEANKEKKVWEFVKGDLRVFGFKDGDRFIIAAWGLKKKQKADIQKVRDVVRWRDRYNRDKDANCLEFV